MPAAPAGYFSKQSWLTIFFLAALTVVVFSPAFRYEFVNYDDNQYVSENANVLHGLSGTGVWYAATTYDMGTWAPVTWISYQLDSSLLGAHASSYHLSNILLHVIAGFVLFLALQLLFESLWSSAMITGIFLLHPLRTESVAWVSERKDVLCTLFWVLGILAYWFYAKKPSVGRWSLVFLCVAAGLMSKMMMVTFPFVLLLLDVWPLKRTPLKFSFPNGGPGEYPAANWRPLLAEKIPFFLGSIISVYLSSHALNVSNTLAPVGENISGRIFHVLDNYVFYIDKIFWPANLSVLYPDHKVSVLGAVFCGGLLLALTLLALWQSTRRPWLAFGWFWFLGALVPVIGFVKFGRFDVADRYTYIPSIGLTLAVVMTLEDFFRRNMKARWLGGFALLAGCAVALSASLPRWQNSFTLFDAALRVGPHEMSYNNRGLAFDGRGDYQQAVSDFNLAIGLDPDSAETYNNRGATYLHTGDQQNAIADFSHAIQLRPDYAMAFNNRGSARIDSGEFDLAIKDCTQALSLNPRLALAWNNRANAYSRINRLDKAIDDYGQAIKLDPANSIYYNNRAAAHFMSGHYDEAKSDIAMCRQLNGQPNPDLVRDLEAATMPK